MLPICTLAVVVLVQEYRWVGLPKALHRDAGAFRPVDVQDYGLFEHQISCCALALSDQRSWSLRRYRELLLSNVARQ